MVEDIKKDLGNIKAGVEGQVTDIPDAPEMMDAPAPMKEEYPEPQTITEDSGGNDNYQEISPNYNEQQPAYDQGMNAPSQPGQLDTERIHEIIERIVAEKWDETLSKMGDIQNWKQKVDMNLLGVKQEVVRLSGRLENLQTSVLGKVQDYDTGIRDIHSEMKALEKVLERIMEPLVTNVKELQKVTEEIKKTGKKR
jgi:hypothetical protein